jgi:hypothetical protein
MQTDRRRRRNPILFGLISCSLVFLLRVIVTSDRYSLSIETTGIAPPGPNAAGDFNISGFTALAEYAPYNGTACEPCDFIDRSQSPDSTQNDAVIATMLNKTYNLVPFVRSLRTTGSQCRIVFIVDDTALTKIDANLSIFLHNCGCTLINIGTLNLTRNDMLLLRNRLLYSFLNVRPSLFDRIVIVDLYDTIFQGDPFHAGFDRRSVGFSLETRRCDRGQIRCAGYLLGAERAGVLWDQRCINVGTVVGTSRPLVRFFGLYVDYLRRIPPDVLERIYWIPDQVIVNAMVHTNVTAAAGLPVRFYECFHEYHVMIFLFNRKNLTYRLGDYRAHAGGAYPLVVHLYDRSRRFSRSVRELCPPAFGTADPYIRASGEYI